MILLSFFSIAPFIKQLERYAKPIEQTIDKTFTITNQTIDDL
jgi:hypothetical protein